MTDKKFSMDDYIDVAERIVAFNSKYPDGTLQTIDWKVTEVGGKTFVVYRAAAFRTADDRRPGHGTAWEPFPGPTPYTKDSELMNAETAAWGRAIVACGLPASRKIASKQEVQARQGNGNGSAEESTGLTAEQVKGIKAAMEGLSGQQITLVFSSVGLDATKPFKTIPRDKAVSLATALKAAERK